MRLFLLLSAINGFPAVALGAFGAHALEYLAEFPTGEQRLHWWRTASHYHLTHSLALGGVAWLSTHSNDVWLRRSGYAFQLGILLFSGSLYTMTLTGFRQLGAITPLGGTALLAGWAGLVLVAVRTPHP